MSQNINFRASSKTYFEIQPRPYPAVKKIPEWFLNTPPYVDRPGWPNDGRLHFRNRDFNTTFKKCVPVLDGLSAGYIIPLWADVMVEQHNGNSEMYWKTNHEVFYLDGNTSSTQIPAPVGYDQKSVYKYNNCWIPQTPKGYSCLIISPLGYNDLPFYPIPSIVDTDRSSMVLLFPMWIKKDFEGIVEKGTPIVQIIPFKRDNWESTFDYYEDGEYTNIIEERTFKGTMVGHYLKNHHSKKKFK